jgi:hypothetical protein
VNRLRRSTEGTPLLFSRQTSTTFGYSSSPMKRLLLQHDRWIKEHRDNLDLVDEAAWEKWNDNILNAYRPKIWDADWRHPLHDKIELICGQDYLDDPM